MTRGIRTALLIAALFILVASVVQFARVSQATVPVQILAFNDFHGGLEPAAGGTGRIGAVDAGGVEYLATHLARLEAENPANTLILSGGDNIGGSPLLSSLFHDEPSVEALDLAGLDLTALGNHDLDEGWWELYRMQRGGCHPVDGCQDGTPYGGARFTYLAANVTLDPRRADPKMLERAEVTGHDPRPLLPAYAIRQVGGVRIGIIGVVLEEAPTIILPASTRGLIFAPEAPSVNRAADELRAQGVKAIVVVMHEGGEQRGADPNQCDVSRDLIDLVTAMSDDVDVVVTGHSHMAYNCTVDGKLVTSAASAGRLLTDIDLEVRRSDGEVVSKQARNVIVTRDVDKAPRLTALLDAYRPVAEKVSNRIIGTITGSLTRTTTPAGESIMGDVVADAFLYAARKTPGANPDLAVWNSGGIRADVMMPAGVASAPVTYAQAFSVTPFGNELITKTLTGEQLIQMLEEQFGGTGGRGDRIRILQVSEGFTFAYDSTRSFGERIDRSSVRLNGKPIVPSGTYRLATSNYLWDGGDQQSALREGRDPVLVGVDYDLLADYFLNNSPVEPTPANRIRKIR